uniref:Uncharacterized protein n=1 Tax=Kalanchoe fedtschenkoi TaxID=63787 RepID=A0A7N1A2Y5_KALFE
MFGPVTAGQSVRSGLADHQTKNSVFFNALSNPLRRNLQHCHLAQGGFNSNNVLPSEIGPRSNENAYPNLQNKESNSHSSGDSMDMHSDSPSHPSSY